MRTPHRLFLAAVVAAAPLGAQKPAAAKPVTPAAADSDRFATLAAQLKFRSIGPALTSGRISDVAVDPTDKRIWFVASAAGGVWKSENAGTSFAHVFDREGSFSIGTVTIDPRNPGTVWVGTGENNAQRVVAYGDGIYKSVDGGKSWKNVGLKESEHIGRVVVDPRNSDVVYVAAQGPLSSKGGERGVYKTIDGGKTWTRVLHVDDWTGANDIQLDPRNPDDMIATTWQRERLTCCFVAGGPGSGVYRSTDGGKTWNKSQSGLPTGELGRIGLSRSPADPRVVYAIVDAALGKGGLFRSRDGGASWDKMSSYQSGGNYYNRIFADPKNVDRVYAADVNLQVSEDAGRSFHRVGELLKHVDNHSVTIDADDTDHLIVGCDGGVYESFDRGKSWRFVANLPVTQFYHVYVDDTKPFYRVFGGAQDNFSVGGPSRTRTINGIRNADWFITSGGDGFGSVVDPNDPNIVYAQSQFGNLSRFNLATGDEMGIRPEDAAGGPGFRWNWDAPLIASPHAVGRLYFAADRVLRSDDRGNSWRVVSPDLSRNIDRTRLKVMDRVWGPDAVAFNQSTTLFGNMTTIAESPVKEGVLFAGTNDGRLSISEDGGTTWRSIDHFPGVPDTTYVSSVRPSQHDVNTVYATFNNYLSGDFKPYVLKSTDLGRTWSNLGATLPARGSAWTIAEDFVDRNLLFVGTDAGVFASHDGGAHWVKLAGGLPTIQVRDIAIQRRTNDLVLATFGRGFYVMDDYSALRGLDRDVVAAPAHLFPSRTAYLYAESAPLGLPGGSFQGAGQYVAENPPYGALITYYLRDALKSRKALRQDADAAATRKGTDAAFPSWNALKAEAREEDPAVVIEVSDAGGHPVRRFTGPATAGINRVAWDLRYQATVPVNGPPWKLDPDFPFSSPPAAPFVLPGTYTMRLYARVDGVLTPLAAPATVTVADADAPSAHQSTRTTATLAADLHNAELQREVLGASALVNESLAKMALLKRAIDETPTADSALVRQVRAMEQKLHDAQELLGGDNTKARHGEHTPPSLLARLGALNQGWRTTLEAPTAAQLEQVEIVRAEFARSLPQIRQVVDVDLKALEAAAERAGVPWTSGRVPKAP
ncbi:MAG: glycosyl hydrolase [Gemmatimonadetes bacterium]|nr:glycosyl hydrolase [Gemmatimonadota bacterium]